MAEPRLKVRRGLQATIAALTTGTLDGELYLATDTDRLYAVTGGDNSSPVPVLANVDATGLDGTGLTTEGSGAVLAVDQGYLFNWSGRHDWDLSPTAAGEGSRKLGIAMGFDEATVKNWLGFGVLTTPNDPVFTIYAHAGDTAIGLEQGGNAGGSLALEVDTYISKNYILGFGSVENTGKIATITTDNVPAVNTFTLTVYDTAVAGTGDFIIIANNINLDAGGNLSDVILDCGTV